MTFQYQSRVQESENHVEKYQEKREEVLGNLRGLKDDRELSRLLVLSRNLFDKQNSTVSLDGLPGTIELHQEINAEHIEVKFLLGSSNGGAQVLSPRAWLNNVTNRLQQRASQSSAISPIEALEQVEKVITQELTEFAEKVHAAAEALTKRSSTSEESA